MAVFWDAASRNLAELDRRFIGAYCNQETSYDRYVGILYVRECAHFKGFYGGVLRSVLVYCFSSFHQSFSSKTKTTFRELALLPSSDKNTYLLCWVPIPARDWD
jgi:uncharacterized membrane protein